MDKTGKNGGRRPETALIYFTQFGKALGGSEYLPLSLAAALQKRGVAVTLALNWRSDVAGAARTLGIPVDAAKLRVEYVKPRGALARRIDAAFPVFSTRRLKRLAKTADIRISTLNIADFGRSAHHFIYLLSSFREVERRVLDIPEKTFRAAARRMFSLFAAVAVRPLCGVRSSAAVMSDPRERIYPNSQFAEDSLKMFYGRFNSRIFYPPTVFEPFPGDAERDPLRVLYIGQIVRAKRIREIIRIVEAARKESGLDFKLDIAGECGRSKYARTVEYMASKRPWVSLKGGLYGPDKARFLASGTYAIHAGCVETFGISITEYLKAGLVPIVPCRGGSPEVAGLALLEYACKADAVRILVSLARDREFRDAVLQCCAKRAGTFSKTAYLERESRIVDEMVRIARKEA